MIIGRWSKTIDERQVGGNLEDIQRHREAAPENVVTERRSEMYRFSGYS
jgi:hypothetical protein